MKILKNNYVKIGNIIKIIFWRLDFEIPPQFSIFYKVVDIFYKNKGYCIVNKLPIDLHF